MNVLIRLSSLLVVLGLLVVSGCQGGEEAGSQTVDLAYVAWEDAIATTHVAERIIEQELGKNVRLHLVSPAVMWQAVAQGDYDAFLAGWLPVTHRPYWERFQDQVVDLGPNLEGAKIGLVVPEYVAINTIPELAEQADMFGGRITGIDPGAGIMNKTREALEVYELGSYTLESSSSAVMTTQLANAIANGEPIVVTGWTPHWKFIRWDLKYLDDPEGVYGSEEQVHTIVRQGLEEDMPEVYSFLERFHWSAEDVQQVMQWNQEEGGDPEQSARRWIEQNSDRVEAWLSGSGGAAE